MATVKRFPGEQYISEEGARQLILRGTFAATVTDISDEHFYHEPSDTEAVRFRHDPKLTLPSYSYNSHEQVSGEREEKCMFDAEAACCEYL